jgi:AAHS family 4-hydroxybenzoate transporter-like MFS transporter
MVLALAVGITGFGVAGSQNSLNTVSGMLYPTAIRSTGVGWSMGIGRIGSIVGRPWAACSSRRNGTWR